MEKNLWALVLQIQSGTNPRAEPLNQTEVFEIEVCEG